MPFTIALLCSLYILLELSNVPVKPNIKASRTACASTLLIALRIEESAQRFRFVKRSSTFFTP